MADSVNVSSSPRRAEVGPLMPAVGGLGAIVIWLSASALVSTPSLATTLIVSVLTPGPPPVLLYWIVRKTC